MQLFQLFTCFAFIFASFWHLVDSESINKRNDILLFKREDKLPFDSLPAGNCTAPSACTNIEQPATCHCNGILTVCQNTRGQFCWGSQSLTRNSGCPSVPASCKNFFSGTASCLCNSEAVLCVDQHNHYCYGHIDATSSVSLAAIPTGSQSLSSNAPTVGQSGAANTKTTSVPSFGIHLIVSAQRIGWILVLAIGSCLASMA